MGLYDFDNDSHIIRFADSNLMHIKEKVLPSDYEKIGNGVQIEHNRRICHISLSMKTVNYGLFGYDTFNCEFRYCFSCNTCSFMMNKDIKSMYEMERITYSMKGWNKPHTSNGIGWTCVCNRNIPVENRIISLCNVLEKWGERKLKLICECVPSFKNPLNTWFFEYDIELFLYLYRQKHPV